MAGELVQMPSLICTREILLPWDLPELVFCPTLGVWWEFRPHQRWVLRWRRVWALHHLRKLHHYLRHRRKQQVQHRLSWARRQPHFHPHHNSWTRSDDSSPGLSPRVPLCPRLRPESVCCTMFSCTHQNGTLMVSLDPPSSRPHRHAKSNKSGKTHSTTLKITQPCTTRPAHTIRPRRGSGGLL